MAGTLTLNNKYVLPHAVIWEFLFQPTAGNYTNGGAVGTAGETLNFNAALNPKKLARPKIPSVINGSTSALPKATDIKVENVVAGYTAIVEQNAVAPTASNFVLRIFAAGSGGTIPVELGTVAYTAPQLLEPFVIQVAAPLRYN
jgi:hypothetical protein